MVFLKFPFSTVLIHLSWSFIADGTGQPGIDRCKRENPVSEKATDNEEVVIQAKQPVLGCC